MTKASGRGRKKLGRKKRADTVVQHNISESPIGWLFRRTDKDGKSLISQAEFQAGERLREDFWFAQMVPNVTSDWSGVGRCVGRYGTPGFGVDMRDAVIGAEERVRRALDAVGPELSGVLIDVCCHLKGIEQAERGAGWPQRSGKVVLQLALARLARHYGFGDEWESPDRAGCSRLRHWGNDGYRPSLD